MKRLVILDALWLGLIVLAGWMWSGFDQAEYADRLDHYGLSPAAWVVSPQRSARDWTVQDAAARLTKAGLTDAQVQFHASGNRIYVVAAGDVASLPLASGRWYSDSDLRAQLPVAVVGAAYQKDLYTGSTQQYLKWQSAYWPVLGVVETRQESPLNRALFLNASGADAAVTLDQVQIYADGTDVAAVKQLVTEVFGGSAKPYAYVGQTGSGDWWAQTAGTLLRGAGLVLGAIALAFACAWLIRPGAPAGLDATMRLHYKRGIWLRAVTHAGVTTVLGIGMAWWWFYLTNPMRMVMFALSLLALFAVVARALIYWRVDEGKGAR